MEGTRREFFGQSAKLVASGLLASSVLSQETAGQTTKPITTTQATVDMAAPKIARRVLGRTGLKLSVISAGTGATQESVLTYAVSQGVNFIHTAADYSGGKSIKEVGKALKSMKPETRKKVYVGLKMTWDASDAPLNEALKTLGCKYVDILFFPIHETKRASLPTWKTAFDGWKKQGKVRFMGLTTHGAMAECMKEALETNWYDCLMPAYPLNQRKEYLPIFKQCKAQNVGLIAMKTKITPSNFRVQPTFLQDQELTTICRTFRTLHETRDLIKAAHQKVTTTQAKKLVTAAELSAIGRCRMCAKCTQACPNGLAVNDIVRSVDYYADTMNDYDRGYEVYHQLDSSVNADNCQDCGQCEAACPNRVAIRQYINRSRKMFA